jgi:hypothetical protein
MVKVEVEVGVPPEKKVGASENQKWSSERQNGDENNN